MSKIDWLMDCKNDKQDLLNFLSFNIEKAMEYCCYELYDSIKRGLFTIKNNKLIMNHFIPKSSLLKNIEKYPEINLEKFNLEPFEDGSDYLGLALKFCCYCFKEFDLKIDFPIDYERNTESDYLIKYFPQQQEEEISKYKFCCKELEEATKLGFFIVKANPYFPHEEILELLINMAITPKKVVHFDNELNQIEGNPDNYYMCYPLEKCLFCKTILIENEEEEEIF